MTKGTWQTDSGGPAIVWLGGLAAAAAVSYGIAVWVVENLILVLSLTGAVVATVATVVVKLARWSSRRDAATWQGRPEPRAPLVYRLRTVPGLPAL